VACAGQRGFGQAKDNEIDGDKQHEDRIGGKTLGKLLLLKMDWVLVMRYLTE
jgi:hypothetical protein